MKRLPIFFLLFLLLLPAAAAAKPTKPTKSITVMSRNLYLGADLIPLAVYGADPANLAPFTTGATGVWQTVQLTDFPTRAEALAVEIDNQRPDVIGLQEAALWRRSQTLSDDATQPVYDFTNLLLKAAAQRGQNYTIAVSQDEFDIAVPTDLGYKVRLTMRDVILVRQGVKVGKVRKGRYKDVFQVPTPIGLASSLRGWVSAKVTVGGRRLTVVNTHLEAYGDDLRAAQAKQLAKTLPSLGRPLVLLGDLNSDPSVAGAQAAAAKTLLKAGLKSAAPKRATCCQDEKLDNTESKLSQWIDHILYRGLKPKASGLVGTERVGNLWPSDHAGVWARFK